MCYAPYNPPWFLQNGIAMTVYTALWGSRYWESTIKNPEPQYHKTVLTGGQGVPIFCWVAIPKMLIVRLSALMVLQENQVRNGF